MPPLNPDHLSPTGIRVTPAACPICGAPITADETFSVRECGHAALRTASGVLVSSISIQASRDRIGQWAARAARYTAGADAAWTELKKLERTDCRLRAAREQA